MFNFSKRPEVTAHFYVSWKDAPGLEPARQFERFGVKQGQEKDIKAGKFKIPTGKNIHVKWHHEFFGTEKLSLLTMTNKKLKPIEARALAKEAYDWVKKGLDDLRQQAYGSPNS